MTNNPTPHREEVSSPAASPAPHIFVGAAIIVVAAALALFLAVQLALPAAVAIGGAVAFIAGAGWLHVRIATPAAGTLARHLPTLDTPKPKKRPRAEPAKIEPAAAAPPAPLAPINPTAAVEPSDLALALLASLKRPDEPVASPPPPTESWNWAIAAHLEQPRAQAAQVVADAAPPAPPAPAQLAPVDMETEVQRVERLVKRLADNVNQLQAMREGGPVPAAQPSPVAADAPYTSPEQLPLFPEPADPGQQLEASINALRRANAMTSSVAVPAVQASEPPAAPAAVATPADPWDKVQLPVAVDAHAASQRNLILTALNEQRIDVFLEPILDLSEQRPQHYEVSIALRTFGGHTIDLTQAASDLSGTGLLPLIDQARIARAANIARRLADRGKTGAVFTEMTGETLEDGGFQETFANDTISVGAFPGQLVLTLPQAHVATFTTADWRTLARLREAGFGFALSDVTSLDMDFARLSQAGFTFARLDAETFLIGLPTAGMIVPPADICRHLAECGLMLIVGGIVEDHQLARIFGFGVLFGQGRLFGGARPMKSEAAVPSSPSSARLEAGAQPSAHA